MTLQVEFHTGVADELTFACRLLRKAYHQGARVLVRGPASRLARLDRLMWTFADREFVPHLRFAWPGARPVGAARTPIWLVDGEVPPDGPPVLVNLGADLPGALDRFERVIEIVAADEADAQGGRSRWRSYLALGLDVKHHPASGAAPAGH
jgi:DNA polymerase III subunit chi